MRAADMTAVFSYEIEMTRRGCVPRYEIFEKVGVLAGVTVDEMEMEMLWRHSELPGNEGERTAKDLWGFLCLHSESGVSPHVKEINKSKCHSRTHCPQKETVKPVILQKN